MLKRLNSMAILLASALVLSLSFGCARNPASDLGVEDQTTYDQTDSGFTNDPSSTYNNNTNTNNTNYSNGYGYGTDPTQSAVNTLTATVMNKDTTGFWLWKKATATIMVTNSSQAQTSGTLSITYTLKGETVDSEQQEVSLAAGESRQIEVKATKHSDDVTVTVTPSGSASYGTSYGNYGSYNSNYGTSY